MCFQCFIAYFVFGVALVANLIGHFLQFLFEHIFSERINRLNKKSRDLKKKTQPEVVVICHLLLDPIGLKAVEEKRPGKDKEQVLDTTGRSYSTESRST